MIDDKMAKMAVNTIDAYCVYHVGCNNCEIRDNCREGAHMTHPFACLRPYPDIDTFGNMQKPSEKPPKFDITLKDSTDFRKYINEIFLREAEKYGLPINTANSIKWFANGKIKVTFVDDDNKTNYIGVAKCHPDDAFNPEIGIKLAIERAAQAMHAPFVPGYDEAYFYVGNDDIKVGVNHHENRDVFNISLGNCFKTFEQADAHKDVIRKRIAKAAKLLEKLREDDKRCDG